MSYEVCIKCKHYEEEDGACYCPSFLLDKECKRPVEDNERCCKTCKFHLPSGYCVCRGADEYFCLTGNRFKCVGHQFRGDV